MPQQKISPARIFLLLSIIISVGAVLGLLSAAGIISKINLPIMNPPVTDFYSCANNSDCIAVKNDCCGCTAGGTATAINKNLKDQWKNNCDAVEPVLCPGVMSNDSSCINKTPKCASNKCVLKELNDVKTEIKSAVIGEDFLITLPANPSTGYSWEADFDKNYLILRSKDFVPDKVSPETVGAGGTEVFTFAPIKAGETTVTMNYSRSWESMPFETKIFKYNIHKKNNEVPIDFYSCNLDSDCVSVKADCCGCTAGGKATAVNKNYENNWKNKLQSDCKEIACPYAMSNDASCFESPKCVSNKCVLK